MIDWIANWFANLFSPKSDQQHGIWDYAGGMAIALFSLMVISFIVLMIGVVLLWNEDWTLFNIGAIGVFINFLLLIFLMMFTMR